MQPTADFDPKTAAKKLLREARSGALATLMPGSGDPYCSLVNVATAADGAPLLLISRLAMHTKNILADPRVSLMLDERKDGDPLEGARVMLMGTRGDDRRARTRAGAISRASRRRSCSRASATSRSTGSSSSGAHLVAGFGRIVDLKPQRCAHRSRRRRGAGRGRAGASSRI